MVIAETTMTAPPTSRSRPTPSARLHVHGLIRDTLAARPQGASTVELIDLHGPSVQARLGEMRDLGDDIRSGMRGSLCYYWLGPDRGAPTRILAGCTIRVDDRVGVRSRGHVAAREAGVVPEEVLDEARWAATGAYCVTLRRAGLGHLLGGPVNPVDTPSVGQAPDADDPVAQLAALAPKAAS